MGMPSNRISPSVGPISPAIIFMVVDLPEPLAPRYPVISPARARKTYVADGRNPEEEFRHTAKFKHEGNPM